MNSIEFPERNYKHFRETNTKFHIFLLLSIMGGISLITIYDRKFRHNRPEEGLPKMITYISPINMVAEDNHLYFAYKSPLGGRLTIEAYTESPKTQIPVDEGEAVSKIQSTINTKVIARNFLNRMCGGRHELIK